MSKPSLKTSNAAFQAWTLAYSSGSIHCSTSVLHWRQHADIFCKTKECGKCKEDETVATVSDTGVNPLPTTTSSVDGKPELDASCSGKSDTVTNIHPTDEKAVENWRGLAVPPKKRKRSSYLSPCPEWLHADPSVRGKRLKVDLLKNGNNQQPVKLRKSRISVLNTCALMLFVNAYVVLTVIVSLLKICLQWGFQQPPPASEIHHHKGIECTGLCTEGRTAERNIQSCPTEVWCPPNRCTMPHLHYHWKVKDKTHLCFINKTVLFRVLWSQQTSHKGNCICLYFCCCTAGFWHGSSSDPRWKKALTFRSPPASGRSKVRHSVPLQSRQIPQKSALCRESFSQLQSGRTYVDWHWPGKQLHRISFEWISLQSDAPGKRFTLRAVIAFRGGLTQDTLGHYVAYCRRSPFVWEMYDDLRSGVTGASDKNKICPHAVLYTKTECTIYI